MSNPNKKTAVIAVDGRQLKVEEGQSFLLDKRNLAKDSIIQLDNVLLFADEKKTQIGTPYLKDICVKAKVLGSEKGDKIIVFKKKRRKGYKVKTGSRKHYTSVSIVEITTK